MTSTSLMHEQGTQRQCSETTQRDRVGLDVGGKFRMGVHMYACGRLILIYGKNHHSTVK